MFDSCFPDSDGGTGYVDVHNNVAVQMRYFMLTCYGVAVTHVLA